MSSRWTAEIQNQLDARHMKQYELANAVGISKQHVSDILTGFRECGYATAKVICDVLGISMDVWYATRGKVPHDLTVKYSADQLVTWFERMREEP